MNIPLYNQWDPRWGAILLGKSKYTMANSGCYVTSFCMAAHNHGIVMDPGEFVTKLNKVKALTDEGVLTYDGLMRAFPVLNFNERVYTSNDPIRNTQKVTIEASIKRIRQLLLLGQPTLLATDENPFNAQVADHAVCAKDFRGEGLDTDFLINNPNGGNEQWFSERYGPVKDKLYGYISVIGPSLDGISQSLQIHKSAGQAAWKLGQAQRGISPTVYYKEALEDLVRHI